MSIDTKKHTSIAPGEVPSRAGLAAAILSINDVVPVANATEQAQIATALGGAPVLGTTPLTTARADAAGLHRIEIGYGATFVPASGVLHFTTDTARDSWTTSYSSLLVAGDVCVSNGRTGFWNGSQWVQDTGWINVGSGGSAPAYQSGWAAVTGGWSGVNIRRTNGTVVVAGAASKASFTGAGTPDPVLVLPADMRPTVRVIGIAFTGAANYVIVDPNGQVYPAVGGSGQFSFSVSVPVGA